MKTLRAYKHQEDGLRGNPTWFNRFLRVQFVHPDKPTIQTTGFGLLIWIGTVTLDPGGYPGDTLQEK